MVTIRSPFCGYNTITFVGLNVEDLSRYSNKIESVSLRKCSYDHRLTTKVFLSAITLTNISQEFLPTRWRQKSAGIDMEQNYVTVALCIVSACAGTRIYCDLELLETFHASRLSNSSDSMAVSCRRAVEQRAINRSPLNDTTNLRLLMSLAPPLCAYHTRCLLASVDRRRRCRYHGDNILSAVRFIHFSPAMCIYFRSVHGVECASCVWEELSLYARLELASTGTTKPSDTPWHIRLLLASLCASSTFLCVTIRTLLSTPHFRHSSAHKSDSPIRYFAAVGDSAS